MKISDVVNYLNQRFPLTDASDFDKCIGLTIGSPNYEVTGIILALDLTKEVIKEAKLNNCNLIISHHPFLFYPINKVLYNDYKGEIIKLMIENDLSLYSMHTNLDVGDGGVNDVLASMLGIEDVKIVNGEVGKENFLRYGKIKETTLGNLVNNVKQIFNLSGVRVLGNLNKKIKTIGIVGGSGAHDDDIMIAKSCGCDCYITGEVHLNNSQYAEYLNISLIEVNHGIEKYVFISLIEELKKNFLELFKFDGKIIITQDSSDKLISM